MNTEVILSIIAVVVVLAVLAYVVYKKDKKDKYIPPLIYSYTPKRRTQMLQNIQEMQKRQLQATYPSPGQLPMGV